MRTCEICGIKERHNLEKLFFARFPLDENRCKEWVKVVGKEDLVHLPIEKLHELKCVCGKHFEKKDFSKTGTRLKRRAIPKLHLTANPLSEYDLATFPLHIVKKTVDEQANESGQASPTELKPSTSKGIQPGCDLTPTNKILKELKQCQCTLATLKENAKHIEDLPSTVMKELVLSALKNQKGKPQEKRWTIKNIISGLAILKRSPKAYKYLQHIIPLPHIKILQNILNKIPIQPGINKTVIQHLKQLAKTLILKNKLCVLVFHKVILKPNLLFNEAADKVEGFTDFGDDNRGPEVADKALVFFIQGINKKYKQPIGFYCLKGIVPSRTLAAIIKALISCVNKTGFTIVATVCDPGPTNMSALKLLKDSHSGGENYFNFENKNIYIIYDVPHLLKSLRNNFMSNGKIDIMGKEAKWSHLLQLEKLNSDTLHSNKITFKHVQPKYKAKMRVKYAAQILSQTVAVFLKLMSRSTNFQDQSAEILDTALIVQDLNRLFDFTNGPSNSDKIIKGIKENVSAKSNHVALWNEYIRKLSRTKFINTKGVEAKNVKCLEGWITTLKSLRDIWGVVSDHGIKCLDLRQLNLDALENLFWFVRRHSLTKELPTCSMFTVAIKTSIIAKVTSHSRHANCEKDDQVLLTNFRDEVFGDTIKENEIVEDSVNDISESSECLEQQISPEIPILSIIDDIEYMEIENDLTITSEYSIVCVSGYLASVFLKITHCVNCKNCISASEPDDNPMYDMVKLRDWWQNKHSLTYPSIHLCRMVEIALKTFQSEIPQILHKSKVTQRVITILSARCNTTWMCVEHRKSMSDFIFKRLSLLLIKRQCQQLNEFV